MAYRYRDTQTGRFASRDTWQRSKAHGGTRYKRQFFEPSPRETAEERAEREEEETVELAEEYPEEEFFPDEEDYIEDDEAEYGGAFDSPGKKK